MGYSYDFRTAKTDPLTMIVSAAREALGHVNEAARLQREALDELDQDRIMNFVLLGIRGVSDRQAQSKLMRWWNEAHQAMREGEALEAREALEAIQQAVSKAIRDEKTRQMWDEHYRHVDERRNTPGYAF
jgi:hypothetical protein